MKNIHHMMDDLFVVVALKRNKWHCLVKQFMAHAFFTTNNYQKWPFSPPLCLSISTFIICIIVHFLWVVTNQTSIKKISSSCFCWITSPSLYILFFIINTFACYNTELCLFLKSFFFTYVHTTPPCMFIIMSTVSKRKKKERNIYVSIYVHPI